LDEKLGGLPVEYREVQGHESRQFATYFPKGIRILTGGVDTGFHHVTADKYEPRLLHICGTFKHVYVTQVNLCASSLNGGDVFVLDNGLHIYQWDGKHSSPAEKLKGAQLVEDLKDERDGKAKVDRFDEGSEDPVFWKLLGGKKPIAAKAAEAPPQEKVLLRLSDASGSMKFQEISRGKVKRSSLKDDDVFIFDTGFEVFAWIGHKTSNLERKSALSCAEKYVKEHNKPEHTPIARIIQGGENEIFDQSFD